MSQGRAPRPAGRRGVSPWFDLGTGRLRAVRCATFDEEIVHEGIPPDDQRVSDIGTVVEIHMRPNAPRSDAELDDDDRPALQRSAVLMVFHLYIGRSILRLPYCCGRLNSTIFPLMTRFLASREEVAAPVSIRAGMSTPQGRRTTFSTAPSRIFSFASACAPAEPMMTITANSATHSTHIPKAGMRALADGEFLPDSDAPWESIFRSDR